MFDDIDIYKLLDIVLYCIFFFGFKWYYEQIRYFKCR